MTNYPDELKEYGKIHGHICFGLAIGYRAAKCAQAEFGWVPTEKQKAAVILGSNACTKEGIRLVIPCSCETNDLLLQEENKYIFIFYHPTLHKAVQITAKPGIMKIYQPIARLKEKMVKKLATKEETEYFWQISAEGIKHIFDSSDKQLFHIKKYEMALLAKISPFEAVYVPEIDLRSCSCKDED